MNKHRKDTPRLLRPQNQCTLKPEEPFLCPELLEPPYKATYGQKVIAVSEMFAPGVPGAKIALSFTVSRFDIGRSLSIAWGQYFCITTF
ncbi:hypothetical protein CIP107527_02098 [Corynebacterium diphtheriae]|nr:hypothetical protein CIP107527_02098 [Corynebacterium diphtheriae]